ncbi:MULTISPECIES: BON domain-containing protein [Micromonospora]|uniref:BON domain-containing protein n=2 Tax=Micromonospora TaxID=1873 RepID=A0A1C4Y8W0_9ACTN|nr:BON domain-containing protein [Micromonospora tulbaghiae]RBJ00814.1 BON domain-containing protein [Micromonospora provocatoris]RLQ00944.1 BON domain-containing protein [Micromonospora sp. BL1]AYF27798.1 BON domain-containing protein [Micromonospora tulbaghiae]MBO4143707.1 BON domain-containing protein [Micromonospora tulbaghiae]MDX5461109.1 BON domain-containing protein [Micromonospora tulbaghiae]
MVMPWPYPEFPFTGGGPEPDDADTRLASLVAQRLSADWTTRRQQITVTVQNRVVILAGLVADPQTRLVAAELAWDVPGVYDVCNALRLYGGRRGGR